ncbi:MAG: riboflavin synthase [Anaerovoracaceae bacterium]
MFTGIIEEIGKIEEIKKGSSQCSLTVKAEKILDDVHKGDSIAVNGICLTVTDYSRLVFTVDVMNETWNRTSLNKLRKNDFVNLERALPANGRFGGHIVTGHIDGTGIINDIRRDSNAVWYRIGTSENILSCIVEKGSVAIDGISLTVAAISDESFEVSVIPHTLQYTILRYKRAGDMVNLENDIIGKYIRKFSENKGQYSISREFLLSNGF